MATTRRCGLPGDVHGSAPNPCLLLVPATRNESRTRRGGFTQTHGQGKQRTARNLTELAGGHGGTGEDLGVKSGGGGGTWREEGEPRVPRTRSGPAYKGGRPPATLAVIDVDAAPAVREVGGDLSHGGKATKGGARIWIQRLACHLRTASLDRLAGLRGKRPRWAGVEGKRREKIGKKRTPGYFPFNRIEGTWGVFQEYPQGNKSHKNMQNDP